MCARFFRYDVSWAEYREYLDLFGHDDTHPPEPAYNIAPTQYVPIVRHSTEDEPAPSGSRRMEPAMWGLVPSWWHKPLKEKRFSTFNARSETVATSRAFRGSFRHRRCLVPVSGFYEWTGAKGARIPFAIGLKNRRWFCFAGLWDRAMIDGSEIDTFTILTTEPNDLMAGLHTRMPVILDPSDYERWLDTSNNKVEHLFEPFPTEAMHAWQVSSKVGNVRNQGIELVDEV